MNDLAYDSSNDDSGGSFWTGDPTAFFESIGAGQPGRLPMPSMLTPSNVRTKARSLSEKVLGHWNVLRTMVERHESTIQKRWMKKTKEQRKKILLPAWPRMALVHRPDFSAWKKKQTGPSRREVFLWPSINQEDLTKPKPLLLMLNSRARNRPDAFSRADIDAARFGITSLVIDRGFLNGHVMMFTGRHTPETYGELISWDDHPDASHWLFTQRGAYAGDGLLILEIQARLYDFLIRCCKGILHDLSDAQITDLETPVLPEPPSVSANEKGLVSLATAAAEAPYRLPANLNLKHLDSLVSAKLSAAEDHFWALREDPAYFVEALVDAKEHRQENLPDTNGRQHPAFNIPAQQGHLQELVLGDVIVDALGAVVAWRSVLDRVVNLEALKARFADEISPKKELPHEYALAFYKLDHFVRQLSKRNIQNLKVGAFASPPMRHYFVRAPFEAERPNRIRLMKRVPRKNPDVVEELIWIYATLFDEQQLHLTGLNTLMDELERLRESDSNVEELTTSWVAHNLSELSVLSHCLYEIELYQPWAATFEDEMVAHQDEIDKDFSTVESPLQKVVSLEFPGKLVWLSSPSENEYRYPIDKRRTKETNETMRRAEASLDAFWREMDKELARKKAVTPHIQQLLSQRVLQRTPEWVEPAKQAKGDQTEASVNALTIPLSELYFEFESRSEQRPSDGKLLDKKDKIKTRGVARSSEAASEPENFAVTQPDVHPTFKVDKRALKVFKTIFFIPSTSNQPGEVQWGDFVHAMISTGFNVEKLYGSVWQFTPTRLDVERSIQFHEPHPTGKIPFRKARRFGRRLNRAYGWFGGMFSLE